MTLVTQGSIGFPDQNPVDTNPTYKHCLYVSMGAQKPVKSWDFIWTFSRTEKFLKRNTGPGKSQKSALIRQ